MTESKITDDRDELAPAIAIEADADSIPFRAAAAVTEVAVKAAAAPMPVPTTRSLRMLLGVLKHNPAGVVREVGVLLMLYVSSVEAAVKTDGTIASAETPPAPPSSRGDSGPAVRGGKRLPPRTKQLGETAQLKRRSEEAATVLALALAAEQEEKKAKTIGSSAAAGVVPAPRLAKRNTTRFRHQLRQPEKVEDRLQAWAATRGREVAGVRQLLAQSTRAGPLASWAGARLVRERVERTSRRKVSKVRRYVLVLALGGGGNVDEVLSSGRKVGSS